MCLPMQQMPLKTKKQVPSPLSFPFGGLGIYGTVKLEAMCQRWQGQRMEGDQVPGPLFGWELFGTITFWQCAQDQLHIFWICLWSRQYNCNYYTRQPGNFLFCPLILLSGRSAGTKAQFWSHQSCSKIFPNALWPTEESLLKSDSSYLIFYWYLCPTKWLKYRICICWWNELIYELLKL